MRVRRSGCGLRPPNPSQAQVRTVTGEVLRGTVPADQRVPELLVVLLAGPVQRRRHFRVERREPVLVPAARRCCRAAAASSATRPDVLAKFSTVDCASGAVSPSSFGPKSRFVLLDPRVGRATVAGISSRLRRDLFDSGQRRQQLVQLRAASARLVPRGARTAWWTPASATSSSANAPIVVAKSAISGTICASRSLIAVLKSRKPRKDRQLVVVLLTDQGVEDVARRP